MGRRDRAVSTPEPRDLIRNAIFALAPEVVKRPAVRGVPRTGMLEHPEPLAGVRAATALRDAAVLAIADLARYAREDGKSWAEIGAAMEPVHDEYSAFGSVASQLGRGYSFAWTCPACGQVVLDYGPEAGVPADQEQGHGGGCTRFAALVAAHEARMEDEDGG
jgi:hypothetical protein